MPEIDVFIYIAFLVLTMVVVFQYLTINSLRDRVSILEKAIKDIQRLALNWLPDEE